VWLCTDKKDHTYERFERPENVEGEMNMVKEVLRIVTGDFS
jgi:hypothetical protein